MLVLDTKTLPASDRVEAFQTAVGQSCSTIMTAFDDPTTVKAAFRVFDFGPARVFNIDASGITLRRTTRMARSMDECLIALALPVRNQNHMSWEREQGLFGTRDMILADLASPYVYGWHGEGASYVFQVDFDQLGVPMDTIRSATRRLHTSPLYPLVREHITRITREAEQLTDDAAATQLGAASVELMHALIISAVDDDRLRAEAMHESLVPRVQSYVRHHLRDPDLNPARIAAANAISVRTLYAIYEELGVSLGQTIIQQRLDGARTDLASSIQRHRSVGAIARAWGFTNPSFFSNRFRQAFGVTPRQWRDGRRQAT